MSSFIKDLYHGRIIPWEHPAPNDPNYIPTNRKISDLKELLRKKLTPEELKHLEELEILYSQSSNIEHIDAFSYGISLGILIMIEVLNFNNKQFTE